MIKNIGTFYKNELMPTFKKHKNELGSAKVPTAWLTGTDGLIQGSLADLPHDNKKFWDKLKSQADKVATQN